MGGREEREGRRKCCEPDDRQSALSLWFPEAWPMTLNKSQGVCFLICQMRITGPCRCLPSRGMVSLKERSGAKELPYSRCIVLSPFLLNEPQPAGAHGHSTSTAEGTDQQAVKREVS